MNCECCKKESKRTWFCEKEISNNNKILKAIIEKYDLYNKIIQKNPILKKQNSIVYSKLKVYELLLKSYEHSIRNRKSTLYFPEGDSIIKEEIKKIIKELAEKNENIIAFSEEKIFLKKPLKTKQEENKEKENKTEEIEEENEIKEKEQEKVEEKNKEEKQEKEQEETTIKSIIKKEKGIIKKITIKVKEENNIIEKIIEKTEEKIQDIKNIFTTKKIESLEEIKDYFEQKNILFKNKIEVEKLIGGFVYRIEEQKGKTNINYSYITENYEYKIKEKNRFKNYCNYAILLRDTLSRRIIELLEKKEKNKEINIKEEIKTFLEKKLKKLTNCEIEYEDLIIKNKLYKNLELYEKETLFVKAAEELKLLGYEIKKNSIIPYIVIEEDKKIIIPTKENFELLKQKFFHIDKEYYLYRQIYPLIKNILESINFKEEEIQQIFYKIKMLN